jgi:hypothetical protein
MKSHERQLAVDILTASQSSLLAVVANLSRQQWHFHESPDRWSIAENIEHLIHFESFINQAVNNSLSRPAEPEKQLQAASKQSQVLSLGTSDSRRANLKAREAVRPTGAWSDSNHLIANFRRVRAGTIAFVSETDADLHNHFFPHIAFGDLDCYQWLLVLGVHTERHILQIQQVQANPAYPVSNSLSETPESWI